MKKSVWTVTAVLVPFAALLIVHAGSYLPFLSDDSLISLRYARRLLDGHGLTWTAGRPVEGYSNLLWILLVAAAGRLGLDLIDAARLLGVIGMVGTLIPLAWWYSGQSRPAVAWFPPVVGLTFLSLGAPMAVWAIGGLEQPLVAVLLAMALPLLFTVLDRQAPEAGATLRLSLVLGLVCLTRPDGPLFAAAAAGSLLLAGWLRAAPRPLGHAALVLVFPLTMTAGQLVFRLAYYGEFVPNTALVKIAASPTHWTFGLEYLASGFRSLYPFSLAAVAALAALLAVAETRARALGLATFALLWSAYVAFIGGDVFPAYRHFVPLMVIFAFALAEGAHLLATRLARRPQVVAVMGLVALAAAVPYVRGQQADRWNHRAVTERWEWQGKEVALLLKAAFEADQPLLAVTAAGCLPYWSELPALDMMGLNDYYLPRHRPETFGTGMVGHELGDGRYVLGREPDLIVFDVGSPQPAWRSGDELNAMPEFHERYVPVTVQTAPAEYRAVVFIDRNSRRIGIRREPDTLTIPGFLFTGPGTVAVPGTNGRLVASLQPGDEVVLRLESGRQTPWSLDAAASGLQDVEADIVQEAEWLTVTLRATGAEPIALERVVLRAQRPRASPSASPAP